MPSPVEFRVMGPIRAVRDGVDLRIGGPRDRAVLARLVLDANHVVSVCRLIDAVWHDRPPASARSQIAICVSRLRRALGDTGEDRAITTASPGYLLRLTEDTADWTRFTGLVSRARSTAATGDQETAVTLMREALALWRGTPFEDLTGLRDEADRLQTARLDAVETCAELELRLGRHDRVGKELAVVVAENPLRERARAQLMLAQYRSGRRAEALRTYQDGRRALVDQIGLEPGPELRRLHDQILRDAPALLPQPHRAEAAPTAPTTPITMPQTGPTTGPTTGPARGPAQLPRQPLPFAGRTAEIAALDEALRDHPDAPGTVVLSGAGEVGKTALALRWAHERMDRFPDGQLHADLLDADNRPVPVAAVLDRFLRGLGVPLEAIPDDHDEKVALYRSTVAHRRLLVLLDNATDDTPVVPLLPSGARCRTIVTSRDPLDELVARQGAHRQFLAPLRPKESWDLLIMLVGRDWVAEMPLEANRIAALSDGYPLSLRRAAARLRPDQRQRSRRGALTTVPA